MTSLAGGLSVGSSRRTNIIPVKWYEGSGSGRPPKAAALFEALLWILNDVQTRGKQKRAVLSFSAGIYLPTRRDRKR
jgi:hypothetical protein